MAARSPRSSPRSARQRAASPTEFPQQEPAYESLFQSLVAKGDFEAIEYLRLTNKVAARVGKKYREIFIQQVDDAVIALDILGVYYFVMYGLVLENPDRPEAAYVRFPSAAEGELRRALKAGEIIQRDRNDDEPGALEETDVIHEEWLNTRDRDTFIMPSYANRLAHLQIPVREIVLLNVDEIPWTYRYVISPEEDEPPRRPYVTGPGVHLSAEAKGAPLTVEDVLFGARGLTSSEDTSYNGGFKILHKSPQILILRVNQY